MADDEPADANLDELHGPDAPAPDDERDVHFWFPITVEVIGTPDPDLPDRVVARVFAELNRELESRA